jgi:hypothetical protein
MLGKPKVLLVEDEPSMHLGGYFTCDNRNIEMLTDSQPANADADSAPNLAARGVWVG